MTTPKLFIRSLGCWCILCIAVGSTARTGYAAALSWTVDGTFDNGRTLSGTFNYDATTQTVSNWNLTGAFNYTYTPADSVFQTGECCTDQTAFIFTTLDTALSLEIAFNSNLPGGGGTATIAGGSDSFQLVEKPAVIYVLTSGTAITESVVVPPPTPPSMPTPPSLPDPTPVPEPASAQYVAGCVLLGLVGAVVRRRRFGWLQP